MAIERVEQRGKWTKVETIKDGTRERLFPRGILQTFLTRLNQVEGGDHTIGVTVISPNKIGITKIRELWALSGVVSHEELEKNVINAREITTGEFGLRNRRKVTYRWRPETDNTLSKNPPSEPPTE